MKTAHQTGNARANVMIVDDHAVLREGLGKVINQQPVRTTVDSLSDRELQIYRCLGEGVGTREIAARLHLAVSTVESYRANIKQKLNLRNATELIASASRFVAS